MLEFFSLLELNVDSTAHVIIFVVDGQLDLLLAIPDLVPLLVFLLVELDVDVDRPGESSEKRSDLLLNIIFLTI